MGAEAKRESELAYYLGDLDTVKGSEQQANEWSALYDAIRQGVPVRNARLMRSRVTARVFDKSVIPRSTLQSKGQSGRLSTVQSERAVRIGRVYARAAEVFGDRERGKAWMERANPALDGHAPSEWLTNEAGARYIEEWLGQLEHGIVA